MVSRSGAGKLEGFAFSPLFSIAVFGPTLARSSEHDSHDLEFREGGGVRT